MEEFDVWEMKNYVMLYRGNAWFMQVINFRIGEKKSKLSKLMSRMLYVEYTETSWKENFSK
jgi:hypothetical protein